MTLSLPVRIFICLCVVLGLQLFSTPHCLRCSRMMQIIMLVGTFYPCLPALPWEQHFRIPHTKLRMIYLTDESLPTWSWWKLIHLPRRWQISLVKIKKKKVSKWRPISLDHFVSYVAGQKTFPLLVLPRCFKGSDFFEKIYSIYLLIIFIRKICTSYWESNDKCAIYFSISGIFYLKWKHSITCLMLK